MFLELPEDVSNANIINIFDVSKIFKEIFSYMSVCKSQV